MACQEVMTLFQDTTYPFWIKPDISSPLLVSFAAVYVAVCQMTVELFDSYRPDVAKEIVMLGNVVDDYRRRFLCFRLYKPKYPIFSRKNIIDKYDEKLRTTDRSKTRGEFDCYCLYRQNYSASLIETYGSFFDSVKAAIVDSGLLPDDETSDETPRNEWCTDHKRCYLNLESRKECFCKDWNSFDGALSIKGKEVEKAIAHGQCLSTISSKDTYVRHYQYSCNTCEFSNSECICRSCMLMCHKGHDVEFIRYGWFFCDCADLSADTNTECQLTKEEELLTEEVPAIEYAWPFVVCKECEQEVVGERYKCRSCSDFDLCKSCVADQVHTNHDDFIRMIKTNTSKGVERSGVHRFVTCDGCEESPLCGRRYKCTQCENCNLCTTCHDNEVHDHDTFEEISISKSAVNVKKIGWGGLMEALKITQQFQSEAYCNENSAPESDDIVEVCLLLDEDPQMPFSGTITCQENTISFAIIMNGRIPQQPNGFEVILLLEDKVLLQFNPRWYQEKIVVSTDDTDVEEYALFSTLVPDEEFRLKILFEESGFQITINDETPINFAQRIIDDELIFKVNVSGDVVLDSVAFNVYNST
ncbi:uncharacterized protein LOC119085305 isoform X3 [Bradysia coprophila]|nr:uncharacterized protein LOC119085305 isoform X3 [Bradysia coprophila]